MKRLHGAKALVTDAVEHASRAVEKVQIAMAKTPFDLLERVPGLKVPVSGVRQFYNMGVSSTHTMIRLATKVAGDTVGAVLDAASQGGREGEGRAAGEAGLDQPGSGSMQSSTTAP